jgi:hypothetical protein
MLLPDGPERILNTATTTKATTTTKTTTTTTTTTNTNGSTTQSLELTGKREQTDLCHLDES